ncbi:cache domain-containing sensor histidine kinase [Paenibacillus sp. strain BS8-2]
MRRLNDFRDLFKQSIQFRLTCSFIMILVPLIAFSLFANDRSQRILEQELGERTTSAMGSTLEYIDLTMGGVKSLSTLLSTDRGLTALLNHHDGERLSTETLIDFTSVMEEISNIAAVNPSLSAVTVYHGNSGRLLSSSIGSLHRPRAAEEQWYREVMQSNGSYVLYIPDHHETELMGWADPVYNKSQIMLMQRMDLYSREQGTNVLMLSVPKSKLLNDLMSLVPSDGSHVYLLDNNGRLIVTNAAADRMEKLEDQSGSGESKTVLELLESERSNMVLRVDSPSTGWMLLLEQPENEIYKKSKPLEYFSYGMILLSCLLAVWISWVVYSGIASPISSLVEGMKLLRLGKLDTRLANRRQDELGYLTDAFNQTVEQQRHLIRDIYEQQLLLTKTELKFLQSQINPHFLYNRLIRSTGRPKITMPKKSARWC